ncbi:MAG: hypothetical protein JRC93_09175 [Deltaproteobacteria bacterium]|nr:hypothetical protein [Deltaproteobacteria bacterium]
MEIADLLKDLDEERISEEMEKFAEIVARKVSIRMSNDVEEYVKIHGKT